LLLRNLRRPLVYPPTDAGLIDIANNTLDQEPPEDIGVHINVESKAPWDEIPEDRDQHDAFPPDMLTHLRALMHTE